MNSSAVFVATSHGLFLGAGKPAVAFGGRHVRSLYSDGVWLFAVAARHEVWRAPLKNATQESAWERLGRTEEQLWALFSLQGELLLGTEGAQLYRLRLPDGAPLRVESFHGNPDRENWYTPWGGPPAIRSFTNTEQRLFVNVHVGGIQAASLRAGELVDADASWRQLIQISTDVHQVLYHSPTGRLFAPSGGGFYWSTDDGETWKTSGEGLDFTYLRAVAVAGTRLIVSASSGPHGDRGALYRRPVDSDGAFTRCSRGLPEWFGGNVDTFCLQAQGDTVVAGVPGGSVYASADAGESWNKVASGLPEINAVLLT